MLIGHYFRSARLVPLTLVIAAGLLGCSGGEKTPSKPAAGPTLPAGTAHARLAEIIALRTARQYSTLREHVLPAHAADLVATLMALDDFLDANRSLQTWVRDHVGTSVARLIDQGYFADTLGVFSDNVALLDETIKGDRATVTYTVAGRLPARVARLQLHDGTWHYDPEGGFSSELPAAFHEMARGLERVEAELAAGRYSADELIDDPEQLVGLIETNLRPGLRQLGRAREAALGDSP